MRSLRSKKICCLMNDFSEIEQELKKLRPLPPSAALFGAIEKKMNDAEVAEKIVPLHQPRVNWLWLGTGLAAAAVILIFVRFQFQGPAVPKNVASEKPARVVTPAIEKARPETRPASSSPQFVPDGLTRVVYHTHDDGVLY